MGAAANVFITACVTRQRPRPHESARERCATPLGSLLAPTEPCTRWRYTIHANPPKPVTTRRRLPLATCLHAWRASPLAKGHPSSSATLRAESRQSSTPGSSSSWHANLVSQSKISSQRCVIDCKRLGAACFEPPRLVLRGPQDGCCHVASRIMPSRLHRGPSCRHRPGSPSPRHPMCCRRAVAGTQPSSAP